LFLSYCFCLMTDALQHFWRYRHSFKSMRF